MSNVVILGAGIAGISAAYHAGKLNIDAIVYEAEEKYGGLLDNFTIEGFRFDKAVHLSFTKDAYVRSLFAQTSYHTHKPISYNFESGKWLKHPVQNNLYPLAVQDKIEAIKGFVERPNPTETDDYHEWLIQQYGVYIAERFPLRYTEKYWTVPAGQLSTDWIGNRLYRPSLEEVLFGAMTEETPNAYYAQEMRYPKVGGYKAFIEPLAAECTIKTGKKAMFIDPSLRYVEFETGEKVYYEFLISTIPLPKLVRMIKDAPETIVQAANTLWATSVALVSFGFNRPDVPPHLWFYLYDESLWPARCYSPSLKASDNVPVGCSSLQFEIYFSRYKPLPGDHAMLIRHCMKSLRMMNLADKEDIVLADCRVLPYGNVVFDKELRLKRQAVIAYLREIDIHVAGRFGEWDYLWSDQSLLSGKSVIDFLSDEGEFN
ncbi:MAG: FAD-dependent oxidoreductase [Sporomusaceae bacterium]|nr:FAD-dependent oxidoreductase [Sporomusaceae bacterium]